MRARKKIGMAVSLALVVTCIGAGGEGGTGRDTSSPASSYKGAPPMEVYFSPHGGCTEAIVREINRARVSIAVQAYSFTHTNIARALVAAHQRGVNIRCVLDKSPKSERYSSATT